MEVLSFTWYKVQVVLCESTGFQKLRMIFSVIVIGVWIFIVYFDAYKYTTLVVGNITYLLSKLPFLDNALNSSFMI